MLHRCTALLLAAILPTLSALPAQAVVVRVAALRTGVRTSAPALHVAPTGISALGNSLTLQPSLNAPARNTLSAPLLSAPRLTQTLRHGPVQQAGASAATAELQPAALKAQSAKTPVAASKRQSTAKRLQHLHKSAVADQVALRELSGEGSRNLAAIAFSRLLGQPTRPTENSAVLPSARAYPPLQHGAKLTSSIEHKEISPEPEPATPAAPSEQKRLRSYMLGTGVFKIGMEALGVSAPLLALTIFGSATWAAMLAIGWGTAQIAFSSLAGGIIDRRSPSKVLAWSMGLQGLTVALLISLFLVDSMAPGLLSFKLASPYVLLALYSLAGGLMGVADTARQVIPPEIIGTREREIKIFNAKTHIAYEIAGVAGAFATGFIIKFFGLVPALLLHPPAYILAAFIFWRMKITRPAARRVTASRTTNLEPQSSPLAPMSAGRGRIGQAFADLRLGAKTIFSKPIYRWAALALVLPLMLHRLLEGLLIPVAAKMLLGDPAVAAWIIAASNAGELVGAILLWRTLKNPNSTGKFRSHIWVRLMAMGLLGLWVFTLAPQLAFVLPLIAFGSLTWAASDLSLRSKLQNALPPHLRGRSFGFLGAAAFAIVMLASLALGQMLDAVAVGPVFLVVGIAVSIIAALMFWAGLKLRAPKQK
jgi:hypothetical protein